MVELNVSPPGRAAPLRLVLAALAGLAAIGAAVLISMHDWADTAPPPASARAAVPGAAAPTPARPRFDVVRVNPRGDAVIAGHAPSGAEVRIEEGGREIGRAEADQEGEWVFVPTAPLPSGGRVLSLVARAPDGRETRSEGSVLLAIPDRAALPIMPVALLSVPNVSHRAPARSPTDVPPPGLAAAARNAQGNQVTVAPGQSLWRIARDAYGSGARYTVLYQANREQIEDPARIYPEQVFAVPTRRGR